MRLKQTYCRRDRGSAIALVATALVPLLAAAALAIDAGYIFVVRNQLQNAADAAALAGGQGAMDQPGNYTADGQAKQRAMQYAAMNKVNGAAVTIGANEIRFPNPNVVLVDLTRPAPTFFARMFGVESVNVRVRSASIVAPVTECTGEWRPYATLDQFVHGDVCVYPTRDNESHGPFNPNVHTWRVNGRTVTGRDYYLSPYDPSFRGQDISNQTACGPGAISGFMSPRDVNGVEVRLENWVGLGIPGTMYQINLGGDYRNNIVNGWSGRLGVGYTMQTMPDQRSLANASKAAINELIAKDPNARLIRDANGRWVVWSDRYPINKSPRIIPMAFIDPTLPPPGNNQPLTISNIGAFFVTRPTGSGHGIWGYFIHKRMYECVMDEPPNNPAPNSSGAAGRLLGSVRLVDPLRYQ